MPVSLHSIQLLGLGMMPPGPELAAHPALAGADVLVAGKSYLALCGNLNVEKIPVTAPLSALMDRLEMLRGQGRRITVLASGDPMFFGIGATLAEHFGPEALVVTPGVSSLQAAAARLALPWERVRSVSLHGRSNFLPLAHAVLDNSPVCVLTDAVNSPDMAARFLLERGVSQYTVTVFEKLGNAAERSVSLSLSEAAESRFALPNVAFFLPDPALIAPLPLALGLPDQAYCREKELITKWPVRAAVLAALRITPTDAVWDLGSGSGSIALEAAFLARRGQVLAVERQEKRAALIAENRSRFGVAHLDILCAELPGCLETQALPDPDRIVIGGGLGGAPEAAEALLAIAMQRLKPGGRLIVSCVLLQSLELARRMLHNLGCEPELLCLQASQAVPLGRDEHLVAQNPVFLLAAEKRILA